MKAVFQREFRSYMHGVLGPGLIALLMLAVGLLSGVYQILLASPRFETVLNLMQLLLLFVMPLLAMRAAGGQKRGSAQRFLFSLPLPTHAIVLGQYLASLAVFGVACGIIALYLPVLSLLGLSSLGSAYTALLGFLLLGAVLLALGTLLSSLTESPFVALLLSMGVTVLLYVMGVLSEGGALGSTLSAVMSAISPFSGFTRLCNGVFDLTVVLFDVLLSAAALALSCLAVERRLR